MNLDSLQNIKVPRQRLDAYEFLPPQDEVDMSELQRYNDAIFCKRMLIGCIIVLIVAISILLWTNTGASLLFSEAVGQSNLSKNKEETSQNGKAQQKSPKQSNEIILETTQTKSLKLNTSKSSQTISPEMNIPALQSVKFPDGRIIKFCIVSAKVSNDIKELESSLEKLQTQSYKQWEVKYFFRDLAMANLFSQQKKIAQWIVTQGNEGQNIYQAIHNRCAKNSYVFLLDYDEQLTGEKVLQTIAVKMSQKDSFAVAVGYQRKGMTALPSKKIVQFKRDFYFRESRNEYSEVQTIINMVRIFQSDLYKMISVLELKSVEGVFYKSKASFLLPIIEMGLQSERKHTLENRYEEFLHIVSQYIPIRRKILLYGEAVLQKDSQELPETAELAQIGRIPKAFSLLNTLQEATSKGEELSRIFANQAAIFSHKEVSIKQQRIPKKIHQIWLQPTTPFSISCLIQSNRRLFKSYVLRVWTKQDITQANFPLSYFFLKKVEDSKLNDSSKLDLMSNIMRYEIIYSQGGFFVDAYYRILQPCLDKLQQYKMVFVSPPLPYFRMAIPNFLFGAQPKIDVLLRLLTKTVLEQINLEQVNSGSYYFQKAVTTAEEADEQIKFLPFDMVSPFYPFYDDQRYKNNKCIADANTSQTQKIAFSFQGQDYLTGCQNIYENRLGVYFFNLKPVYRQNLF